MTPLLTALIVGLAAIFLPKQRLIFTPTRYLLLIPAFIFHINLLKAEHIAVSISKQGNC